MDEMYERSVLRAPRAFALIQSDRLEESCTCSGKISSLILARQGRFRKVHLSSSFRTSLPVLGETVTFRDRPAIDRHCSCDEHSNPTIDV